ncbi:MAG: AAA family ATPase [Planctomycetes bacterium]|nr:AAA family ATPase [Planctomycetota bacterium]
MPFVDNSEEAHRDQPPEAAQIVSTIRIETIHGNTSYLGEFRIRPRQIDFDRADAVNLQGRFLGIDNRGISYGLTSQWTSVLESGQAEPVVSLLQAFDSEIQGVALRADKAGRAVLRIDHKSLGIMPVEMQGAGVGKALAIASHLVDTANGMLMIDEIDSSLHVGVLERVIKFTLQAANRHNVQLFASTHSLETLDAFLDAYEDMSDLYSSKQDFRILQLKREGGRTVVTNLDAEEARRMRDDLGLDLRRT